MASGDPQTHRYLNTIYVQRVQPDEEEWRNLENGRQIEIFAPWSNALQRIPYVVGGGPLSLR